MKVAFEIGAKLHVEGRIYYVVDYVNADDPHDRRIQGLRYMLEDSKNQLWSVTEKELLKKRPKILNEINTPKVSDSLKRPIGGDNE